MKCETCGRTIDYEEEYRWILVDKQYVFFCEEHQDDGDKLLQLRGEDVEPDGVVVER